MQIVIEIPEEKYNTIKNKMYCGIYDAEVYEAIANGTPLPKGHGNIYDENDIEKGIENPYQCRTVLDGLELVKPIIESDTESEG